MKQKDVIIVGAGPAGLSFACSLAGLGLDVLLIEKSNQEALRNPALDGREIALTHASRSIMKDLGAWQRLPDEVISPINHAKVLSGNSDYSLNFGDKKTANGPLGFLVPNEQIRKVFYEQATSYNNIEILPDTVVEDARCTGQRCEVVLDNGLSLISDLLIAADSRFSSIRKKMGIAAEMKDFSRVAIVCRMKHEKSHNNTAIESFQYGQTMAILPMNNSVSSVVITVSTNKSRAILDMSEQQFNRYVEKHLAQQLGEMGLSGERYSYPLVGVHAKEFVSTRFALIGDAAVGMHPVTAHGFNLGLLSQETLHKEIKRSLGQNQDFFSPQTLKRYQRKHMLATRPMYHGTNAIVDFFTNDRVPAKVLRGLTLRIVNNLPPVKQLITNKLSEKKRHLPSFLA